MNIVVLTGRLTRDPEMQWVSGGELAVTRFAIAVDRFSKKGEDSKADFPRITVFGKQAENCDRYLEKGRLVGIVGRIQTGKYEREDGTTAYTTDVIADRVEFLGGGSKNSESKQAPETEQQSEEEFETNGFSALQDDDIPF